MTEVQPRLERQLVTLARAPGVVERVVDGELVLYDPARQRVHVLNPTAAFVWARCDGSHAEAEIVEALALQYPDSRALIEVDVPSVLRGLQAEGLLA